MGPKRLSAEDRAELARRFESNLDPDALGTWYGLNIKYSSLSDRELIALATGVVWMTYSDRKIFIGDGPSWEGPASPLGLSADPSTAITLAEVMGIKEHTPSFDDDIYVMRFGEFDNDGPPLKLLMARAHAAWARRRYPRGHPLHPDTYSDLDT